jgi:stearoyl-CoA desaturase (delta-9 desaturase)
MTSQQSAAPATTAPATPASAGQAARPGPQPIISDQRGVASQIAVYAFSAIPLLAVALAVPFAWGWGLGWTDVVIAAAFYVVSGLGITVGFHRYFTHGSFKANRPLKITLAAAGQMAVQGPVIIWVADHRRHHAFSDREGDPHSPWLFGTSMAALARGFWHARMGWIFDRDMSNQQRFAPDLLADKDIVRANKCFWVWTIVSVVGPAVIGGLITVSWVGALTAFFWFGSHCCTTSPGR